MTAALHPDLAPLAGLLGTWSGRGAGRYPTIEPFEYEETVTFNQVGKPFLAYSQRTRHGGDGRPLHAEVGYWRLPHPDRVEVVLAHPTGITETAEGRLAGGRLALRSTVMARTTTALEVTAVERDLEIDGDRIHYVLRMAAVGQPMTHHLEATLERVG